MREEIVAGFILLGVGCLLLTVGLVAVSIPPEGLRFFATLTVSENGRYEALQASGFILLILGVIAVPAGAGALILELIKRHRNR